jgi:hypothetical protein
LERYRKLGKIILWGRSHGEWDDQWRLLTVDYTYFKKLVNGGPHQLVLLHPLKMVEALGEIAEEAMYNR